MHLIKTIVSLLLLVTSVCWLAIQHLFLTPDHISRIIANSVKPFYSTASRDSAFFVGEPKKRKDFDEPYYGSDNNDQYQQQLQQLQLQYRYSNNDKNNNPNQNKNHNFLLQLRRDWCRVKSKQIAWREILGPCLNNGDLLRFMNDKR